MLIIDSKANNNKHSGGFPHSEILGSKVILTSPKLIAEYHVIHRILLTRHPPNALFALDLFQYKSDLIMSYRLAATCGHSSATNTLVHMFFSF